MLWEAVRSGNNAGRDWNVRCCPACEHAVVCALLRCRNKLVRYREGKMVAIRKALCISAVLFRAVPSDDRPDES